MCLTSPRWRRTAPAAAAGTSSRTFSRRPSLGCQSAPSRCTSGSPPSPARADPQKIRDLFRGPARVLGAGYAGQPVKIRPPSPRVVRGSLRRKDTSALSTRQAGGASPAMSGGGQGAAEASVSSRGCERKWQASSPTPPPATFAARATDLEAKLAAPAQRARPARADATHPSVGWGSLLRQTVLLSIRYAEGR